MKKHMLWKTALVVSIVGPAVVRAQRGDRIDSDKSPERPQGMVSGQSSGRAEEIHFIPDVPGQFQALARYADPLGFHITTTPDPSACRHYQGIVRVNGADGTPFFLVSRSGNTPDIENVPVEVEEALCDDSDGEIRNGNLIVFRMDSRDKNGERLRSNRFRKGEHVNVTEPPLEDRATIFFTVAEDGLVFRQGAGSATPKVYMHPGGMQVVGHMLALASETPRAFPNNCIGCFLIQNPPPECDICLNYERASSPTMVMFFDVSNPEDPLFKSKFAPVNQHGDHLGGADGIGVTPLKNGLYLMALTPGFGGEDPIYFYRSLPLGQCTEDGTDCTIGCGPIDCSLANPALSWEYIDHVSGPNGDEDAHQSLHFIREGSIDGALYLAGARGHPVLGDDHDKIDLYLVQGGTEYFAPGEEVTVTTRYRGKPIGTYPSTAGNRLANLAAATGFYESPSGELIFYATEHDNDGPDGTVKAGEWRHKNVVRDDSPTLLPTAQLQGPYDVNEGSSVSLDGTAAPPITKAWIQLFHDVDFGGVDHSTAYPVVDYADYDFDNFDNFFALEPLLIPTQPPTLFTHNDKARSIKAFAPVGCSIEVLDHHEGNLDETRAFIGDGIRIEEPDLSETLNDGGTDDIDQELDAVDFLADCDDYYAAPIDLQWDLDLNGSFETTGTSVAFSAAALDGPSTIIVPARAQHPAGGPAGTAAGTVNVLNVPPVLTPLVVTNGAGQVVNVDVPFVLTNLPVEARSNFTDPGLPDHQTGILDWGDGLVDPQSAFTAFDEAFGDGTGGLAHTHAYALSGVYLIDLSVSDDDGGVDHETTTVQVVTPEEAVDEIIQLLDDLIAGASGSAKKNLLKARKALAGSEKGYSNNGALAKIRDGNDQAAVAFLNQAIGWLELAQEHGADVGILIAVLEQVVIALSAQ